MAKVQGIKEKLHLPLYDAFVVKGGTKPEGVDAESVGAVMDKQDPRMIRFFVDVQGKTKLETNLQASGVLPSMNTFEARAMRVVVSPPHPFAEVDPLPANPTAADFLSELIYNSVTTLLVGEKTMIEMPTYYFPAGAGVSAGTNTGNHGEPDPMATFRFAEPVTIDRQQNFRVEMLFPQSVPQTMKDTRGPLRMWVVLDGYLTRDVQ